MLTLFLKQKWLSFKNTLTPGIIIRRLPFIGIGAGFWVLLYLGSCAVLSYIRGIDILGEVISEKLFSLIFFSLTGFLVLSNVITALSSFYLSKDLPFLLSKPLELRHLIRLKTFDALLNSSWMVISFVPPVFVAYGVSYHAPWDYYLGITAVFLFFLLITAGIGITIAHLLARAFPARRSRDLLLGIGLILFLGLYFAVQSLIPKDLGSPEAFVNSFIQFRSDSPLLPGYWAAGAVLPLLKNRGIDLFYLTVLFSNSAFLMLVSSSAGMRLFLTNINNLQPSGRQAGNGVLRSVYPAPAMSLLYKDAKIFFRDAGQWSQVFIIGALMMVYIYNFRSIPVDALLSLSPFVREIMILFNIVMAGLVLSAVAARFLYTSVSYEGQAFWIVRSSPVTIRRFLWSKLLYGSVPVTILIFLLVFLANEALHAKGAVLAVSYITVIMLCVSVSGLGTGLGAIFPKFRFENIASVSMSLGGMTFMLVSFSVVLATVSLEAWVFYLWNVRTAGLSPGEKLQVVVCVIAVPVINAAAFYLPMRLGERKLIRGEG